MLKQTSQMYMKHFKQTKTVLNEYFPTLRIRAVSVIF